MFKLFDFKTDIFFIYNALYDLNVERNVEIDSIFILVYMLVY
jgi:hypothetical protein